MSNEHRRGTGGGIGQFFNFDPTQTKDLQKGEFNSPQAIDQWRAYTLWSTRTDQSRQSQYTARQLLAFPHTIIGFLALPGWFLVGAFMRYSVVLAFLSWGYLAVLPLVCYVALVGSMIGFGATDREITLPVLIKVFLLVVGGIVL